MKRWKATVNVSDLWRDDDLSLVEKAEKVAARLKTRFTDEALQDLADDLIEAAHADTAEGRFENPIEFNYAWSDIYDWADAERVWIDTFGRAKATS